MIRLHPIPKRANQLHIRINDVLVGTALTNPSGAYTCRFRPEYFTTPLRYERVLTDEELHAFCVDHCKLFAKSTANV